MFPASIHPAHPFLFEIMCGPAGLPSTGVMFMNWPPYLSSSLGFLTDISSHRTCTIMRDIFCYEAIKNVRWFCAGSHIE